ncbi:MAG: hypothetical protein H7319_03720 [Spirosoma sp.]|nr:hypothetical protein [Spirosoma sp.]
MQNLKTLITVLALTLFLNNCRSSDPYRSNYLGSATTIPPGKDFELGGNGNGAFSAQVRNVGGSAVAISQRQSDGQVTSLGKLQPGDQRILQFVAGSTAVFSNASAQSAELGLKVIGDTNLRMGYAKEN